MVAGCSLTTGGVLIFFFFFYRGLTAVESESTDREDEIWPCGMIPHWLVLMGRHRN